MWLHVAAFISEACFINAFVLADRSLVPLRVKGDAVEREERMGLARCCP